VNWRTAGLSLVACFAGSLVSTVSAQGIALDLSAGQIVYQPLPADVATNNAAATLRYDSPQGVWLYGTAAMPFGSTDSRWGGLGIGDRFVHSTASSGRINIGADIGAHGFLFRDAVVDQSGNGGFAEALPFVQVPAGLATFEVGGGWRGQTLSYAGTVDTRHVFESRVHASYGTVWTLEGDARWVRASEGLYPFFGGGLRYRWTPVQAWLQTGKWLSTTLDDAAWAAGVDVTLTDRLALEQCSSGSARSVVLEFATAKLERRRHAPFQPGRFATAVGDNASRCWRRFDPFERDRRRWCVGLCRWRFQRLAPRADAA
jgi:hypothetical protein